MPAAYVTLTKEGCETKVFSIDDNFITGNSYCNSGKGYYRAGIWIDSAAFESAVKLVAQCLGLKYNYSRPTGRSVPNVKIRSVKRVEQSTKKDVIVKAALECFQKKGYRNTTMEDIVKQSGVSKGGIYWHFKSKEDIFVYMLEQWTGEWLFEVNTELAKLKDINNKLTKYGELYCKSMDFPLARLLPEFWSADITGENKKRLKQCFEAYRGLLVYVFKEALYRGEILDKDAKVLAHLLISMLDGIALYWTLIEEGGDLQSLVREGVEVFWRGIRRQGGLRNAEC